MVDIKSKVRKILYISGDVCRAALAAVDARNTQVLQRRNFSVFKIYCRESMCLCGDITREVLAAVDRRNDHYMRHWISASKKRHAARQKMSVFKNAVGNVLETAHVLKRAAFTATDYNDADFLHEVLNLLEASSETSQSYDEDNSQCNMEM